MARQKKSVLIATKFAHLAISMMYRPTAAFALFAALIFPATTAASEDADPPEEEPAITVTAAESSADEEEDKNTVTTTARAPLPRFAAPRNVGVVGEDDLLAHHSVSVTDAVEKQAGIARQATNRGSDSLFIRGLIGPENVIVVDGIRFNQSTFRTGPNQYLATVDPWAVSKVETLRGPGGVLYGSGAMGGVLQLFPRAFPEEDGSTGRAIAMAHSADQTAAAGFDRTARWPVPPGSPSKTTASFAREAAVDKTCF